MGYPKACLRSLLHAQTIGSQQVFVVCLNFSQSGLLLGNFMRWGSMVIRQKGFRIDYGAFSSSP